MSVDDCVERQAVAPRSREVANVDVLISGSFHLTPKEQSVLGGLCLLVVDFFDCNVLNLESEDDCPDETQVQLKQEGTLVSGIKLKFASQLTDGLEKSTISCAPMFSKCTRWSRRNCSALSTFSRQWILILPFVGFGKRSPDRISSSLMRFLPSRISTYRSLMRQFTCTRWEFTHFVKVFFCTVSRSSVKMRKLVQIFFFRPRNGRLTGQSLDSRSFEKTGT